MKKTLLCCCLGVALGLGAFANRAEAVGRVEIEVGRFAIEKGVFNAIFAKEFCSCQFVDGLTLEECKSRDNLPPISHSLVEIEVDPVKHTVRSTHRGVDVVQQLTASLGIGPITVGGPAEARFDESHPEFGCVLTTLPTDGAVSGQR